jgi:hypothetical protein
MPKLGWLDYMKAAFNARPAGMFVAPNWILIGAFALLGILSPGFFIIGAGVELAYLLSLASSKRFQKWVYGRHLLSAQSTWQTRQRDLLNGLSVEDRAAYLLLEQRCNAIIKQQADADHATARGLSPELMSQAEGLGRLKWIYLRLLNTRERISKVLRESMGSEREPIDARVERLAQRLEQPNLDEDLRRSMEGQLDILRQRADSQREARNHLAFIESELTRIRDQVELIKEQSALNQDPATLSSRIDEIGGTLSSTQQWMRDRQQIYGAIEAELDEPPAMLKQ